jgi:VWFA-related protein
MDIRLRVVLKTASLALLLGVLLALAQQEAPLIRSNSRLVLLDVVVTDKNGHSVRGLTKDDFSVLENGVTQKIASFEAVTANGDGDRPKRSLTRNVILLDELNVAFEDLAYARDRIAMFLDGNPIEEQPTSLMVVGPKGLAVIADFTKDRQALKDKLRHLPAYDPNPKRGGVDVKWAPEHAKASMRALLEVAEAEAGSPYRMNVIWVTSGFPGVEFTPGSNDKVDNGLRQVTNVLMRARMRLYTIDPAGVMPLGEAAGAAKITRGAIQDGHNSAAEGMLRSTGSAQITTRVLVTNMTAMTGGLAYYGRNDVEEAISDAIVDGSTAYTLSYSPSDTNFDGKYRNIDVRTNVADSKARTRQGYYAVADDAVKDEVTRETYLEAAIASPLIYAGFNVSCPASFDETKNRLTGKVVVTPQQVTAGTDQREQIIRVASFAQDHKLLNKWVWRVNWKNPWTNREVSAAFDKVLDAKARTVRFLVSDPGAERIGTCEYRLP